MKQQVRESIPGLWFEAEVPCVMEGEQAYFWAWIVEAEYLDVHGDLVTAREPEIVRVVGADEECDREIYRAAKGGALDPSSFRGSRHTAVLWKGPVRP